MSFRRRWSQTYLKKSNLIIIITLVLFKDEFNLIVPFLVGIRMSHARTRPLLLASSATTATTGEPLRAVRVERHVQFGERTAVLRLVDAIGALVTVAVLVDGEYENKQEEHGERGETEHEQVAVREACAARGCFKRRIRCCARQRRRRRRHCGRCVCGHFR